MAPAFDPPLSFAPGAGWLWSPNNLGFALTRDNGLTFLAVYRYGGAVVPHYCVDPPKTIATRAAADVVAWVKTVPGLQAKVTDRKVGTHRAWQLDLYAANPAGCAKDKVGLAALWTVAGADVNAPEVLGGGDRLRAYLIEVPTGIVVITVSAHQMSSKSYNQFLVDSDRLFSSLAM